MISETLKLNGVGQSYFVGSCPWLFRPGLFWARSNLGSRHWTTSCWVWRRPWCSPWRHWPFSAFGTAGCTNPSCSSPPCAAPLLGDVGCTSVAGMETYNHEMLSIGDTISSGAHIFGPFEAGFTSQQDNIISTWGCSTPSVA